jgi:Zn-finger nucleic acid-binding protein
MDRLELGPFCIDRCPFCGGLWLDAAELDKVLALNKSAAANHLVDRLDAGKLIAGGKTATRTMRQCPRDQSALAATQSPTQSHVVFDRCPACLGLFLDAGELKDLAEHTLAEKLMGFFKT